MKHFTKTLTNKILNILSNIFQKEPSQQVCAKMQGVIWQILKISPKNIPRINAKKCDKSAWSWKSWKSPGTEFICPIGESAEHSSFPAPLVIGGFLGKCAKNYISLNLLQFLDALASLDLGLVKDAQKCTDLLWHFPCPLQKKIEGRRSSFYSYFSRNI